MNDNFINYGSIEGQKSTNVVINKQELKRTLSTFATFGLAFSNIGILSNTSATFQIVLQRGGPLLMLLGWNIVAFFMICVALSLAEICSMYPKSGGLYYWVYELLNSHSQNQTKAATSAFITGWSYYLGNIISISANNVAVALSIGSILNLMFDIHLSKTSLMGMTLVITALHAYLNARDIHHINILNQWNVFWSCTGLMIVIVALYCFAPHRQARWVFTHYENQTGFDNPIYVFILGTVGSAYSLFGCECAASVNEETKEADISSSIAIISSLTVAWIVGLAFLIVLLFSIQDINSILNTSFDMPVAQLFQDAIGTYGTLGFLILIVICQFCTGASTLAVASRQIYALARDNATPSSSWLKSINTQGLPRNAVLFTFFLSCFFILPFPFSDNVFDAIISAATVTIHFSYAMVLGCSLMNPTKKRGRFNLGRWGYLVNVIGFSWTIFAVFAFLLPTSYPFSCMLSKSSKKKKKKL
ncbi:unnamed protein product [Rhizopus stolonifer]